MNLYGIHTAKTMKTSHPWKRRGQINMSEIILSKPESDNWLISMIPVITNLWKGKVVYALVTTPKKETGRLCLFSCTVDFKTISFNLANSATKIAHAYEVENTFYLPLSWYGLGQNIIWRTQKLI